MSDELVEKKIDHVLLLATKQIINFCLSHRSEWVDDFLASIENVCVKRSICSDVIESKFVTRHSNLSLASVETSSVFQLVTILGIDRFERCWLVLYTNHHHDIGQLTVVDFPFN